MKRATLTQAELKSVLSYDPETGIFTKLTTGKVVGCDNSEGYLRYKIGGRLEYLHRLACLYMIGEMPPVVDHENGNRSDNSWNNLRPANKSLNGANSKVTRANKSGFKGVSIHKGKWRATITINRHQRFLGYFESPEEASKAYGAAAAKCFGEFARAG